MGRYIRIEKLYSDDIWMAITILPLCWRLGFIHVVLKKGTGNVAGVENISESELKDREWGTGMVLGARVGLAC